MEKELFVRAEEVARELGISKPYAYKLVREMNEELKEKATSLMIETGAPVKRSALIAAVMKHFEINYALFMENGDLSGLQESYNEMLVNRGKEVRILEPGNEYNAHAYGINETGELIVRTQKGEEKHIFAGEVSVRGIYGYV